MGNGYSCRRVGKLPTVLPLSDVIRDSCGAVGVGSSTCAVRVTQLSEGARRGRIAAVAERARVMEHLQAAGTLPPAFGLVGYSEAPPPLPAPGSPSLMSRKTRQVQLVVRIELTRGF
jgi:hypothetical protein